MPKKSIKKTTQKVKKSTQKEEKFGKGLTDRPDDPKDTRDFRAEEVANFAPAVWVEKKPEDFATYPIKDQNGSSSCVAQSFAKQLEVDELTENGNYRILSPRSIYPFGFLEPSGGMNIRAAAKLVNKNGATLEVLLPSYPNDEASMRNAADYKTDAKQIALVYKSDSVVFCNTDFETIASILQSFQQQGKKKVLGIAVMGWNNGTWLSQYPQPLVQGQPWYHKCVATDFGLINGKKFISIDNSWGEVAGLKGKQFLGLDYQQYIYSVDYTLNLPDNWRDNAQIMPKPKYHWDVRLMIGSTGPDVLALQQALQYLGMFPISSVISPTGSFYGITRKAVLLFQSSFKLPETGEADSLTREKLNELFA